MATRTRAKQVTSGRPRRATAWSNDDGVSPVVGSILILALTVVGMGAILFWGMPAVQDAQQRATQDGMEETLKDLRQRTLVLGVPDAAQVPVVRVAEGSLATSDGDHWLVSANHDATNPDCEFRLTNWDDGDASFTLDLTACRTPTTGIGCTTCLVVSEVAGGVLTDGGATLTGSTVTVTSPMAGKDWYVRMFQGTTTYAQAWIVQSGDISWTGDGRSSRLTGGAIYSQQDDVVYLLQHPPVQENAFGTGDYLLRLPTTSGSDSTTSGSDIQFYLGLSGIHARIDDPTYTLRYQASGSLAESWCNAWLLRNQQVAGTPYVADDGCDAAEPSVRYRLVDPPSGNPGAAVFNLEVLQIDVQTELIL